MNELSYRVVDQHGNIYLCNLQYSIEEGEHTISLGGTHSNPCVRIRVTPEAAILEGVSYYLRCNVNKNGLPRGVKGSKSMVQTALCIAKHFYPMVKKYQFHDISEFVDGQTNFTLPKYYLLKHGVTWYQSFLKLENRYALTELRRKLSSLISGSISILSHGYGIDALKIRSVLSACTQDSSWYDFHKKLFEMYPDTVNDVYFNKILNFHMDTGFHDELSNILYTGLFQDIPCDNVFKMEQLSKYIPFGQLGGTPSITDVFRKYVRTKHVNMGIEEAFADGM